MVNITTGQSKVKRQKTSRSSHYVQKLTSSSQIDRDSMEVSESSSSNDSSPSRSHSSRHRDKSPSSFICHSSSDTSSSLAGSPDDYCHQDSISLVSDNASRLQSKQKSPDMSVSNMSVDSVTSTQLLGMVETCPKNQHLFAMSKDEPRNEFRRLKKHTLRVPLGDVITQSTGDGKNASDVSMSHDAAAAAAARKLSVHIKASRQPRISSVFSQGVDYDYTGFPLARKESSDSDSDSTSSLSSGSTWDFSSDCSIEFLTEKGEAKQEATVGLDLFYFIFALTENEKYVIPRIIHAPIDIDLYTTIHYALFVRLSE